MNDRIKRLAEQATIVGDTKHSMDIPSWYLEKFAELIVKECAEFAEQKYGNWYRMNSPDDAPSITIKKHFGVEE